MKTNIRTQGIQIKEDEKQYVADKIFTLMEHYFDDPSTACDINIRDINGPRGGIDKEIDIVITLAHQKNPIKISQKGTFIKETIDIIANKTDNILRKLKEIRTER